jgi:pyruvate ferredoxin oxidoreductase gamma subunit
MYRIRFHGRGGQGIKTASQILGSAFFRAGYEVQDAPRYGAERRGAPIFAYVRAARTEIHERGVITRPDLVVVADASLVAIPAAGVLQGLTERTLMLIAGADPAEVWRDRLKLAGPVVTLAPDADALRVGVRCAGAAACLVGAISRACLADAVRDETGRFGDHAMAANLAQALAAFDAMGAQRGRVAEGGEIAAEGYAPPEWIDVPVEPAPAATTDIRAGATSELAQTGLWRTQKPIIDYQRCTRCSWICGTFCPDSAIAVLPDHTPRIDYDHCKGCMICLAVCPPHAIRAEPEREAVA